MSNYLGSRMGMIMCFLKIAKLTIVASLVFIQPAFSQVSFDQLKDSAKKVVEDAVTETETPEANGEASKPAMSVEKIEKGHFNGLSFEDRNAEAGRLAAVCEVTQIKPIAQNAVLECIADCQKVVDMPASYGPRRASIFEDKCVKAYNRFVYMYEKF